MRDEEILALYIDRDEQAIQYTAEKYGGYCMDLANRILKDREDAQETVNDTYLKAWQSIPPENPNVLRLYLARITRNIAFSRYRAQNARKRGGGEIVLALDELAECVGEVDDLMERVALQDLTAAIAKMLDTLSARDRNIFIHRYFYVEDTAQIAHRYSVKESNVLMILSRTRKKLKEHLIMEGYSI